MGSDTSLERFSGPFYEYKEEEKKVLCLPYFSLIGKISELMLEIGCNDFFVFLFFFFLSPLQSMRV